MSYDIRFVRLVTGETVIGEYSEEKKALKDVAIVQVVPAGNSMQIMILPYGFPYEEEVGGEISEVHIIYTFEKTPEDLKNKYLETRSSIKIASAGDLGGLGGGPRGGAGGLIL